MWWDKLIVEANTRFNIKVNRVVGIAVNLDTIIDGKFGRIAVRDCA